jgi:hypothetical protein
MATTRPNDDDAVPAEAGDPAAPVAFTMTLDNSLYLGDEWVKDHPKGGTVKVGARDANTSGGWVTVLKGEVVDSGVFPMSVLAQLVTFGRAAHTT